MITGAPNVPNGIVYDGYRNRIWQREEVAGIHVIRVWTFLAANKGTARRILNYLSYMISASIAGFFISRPDVVIATSPQFFCGWSGAILSRLKRVPFFLEIRDIWPESIVAVGALKNEKLLTFLSWLELKLYAASDHIVTVGEGYRNKLLEKKISPKKISIITNGVDTTSKARDSSVESLQKEYSLSQCFVCSYIGTIGMACGLDIVLRAAKILQKGKQGETIRFLLVGDGADRERLEQDAKNSGLVNVIFTGRQSKELVTDLIALSDVCLVHLIKTELFKIVLPSKILDAAVMSRPIIIGVEGYAADLVKKAGAGLCIEPENEKELLAAIEKVHKDPKLANLMGTRGRSYILRNFDRDLLAREYLELIGHFISTKSH